MAEYKNWDVPNLPKFPLVQDPSSAMEEVAKAARSENLVAIRYRAKDGKVSERLIEPYEFKEGKLYGFDVGKHGIRAFILSNLLGAVQTNQPFEPRYPILISSPYYGEIDS